MQRNKQFFLFIRSLKFRLILLILIIAVVPGLILSIGILYSYESRAVTIRESEILSQAKILANQIAASEYMSQENRMESGDIQAQINMLTTIYDGRVMLVDNYFKVIHDTYNLDDHKIIIAEEVMRSFRGEDVVHYDSENHYIEMTVPISNPDDRSGTIIGVMLVSVSTDNIEINQAYLRQVATIIVVVEIAVILFFGILLVLHFVKPLGRISEGIALIRKPFRSVNVLMRCLDG